MLYCIGYNFLNNGLIQKIQSSTESAKLALLRQSDNPQVSLIRTKCWGQKGADYWKFTVLIFLLNAVEAEMALISCGFTDNISQSSG